MKTSLILASVTASTLSAQSFGIQIGAAQVKPQTVETISADAKVAAVFGASLNWSSLSVEAFQSSKQGFGLREEGELSDVSLGWNYRGVGLTYYPTIHGQHRAILGVMVRREVLEAPSADQIIRDTRNRTWGRVGYEYVVRLEDPQSPTIGFGFSYAFTKRDKVDVSKDYTTAEALRLFAPYSEISATIAIRF